MTTKKAKNNPLSEEELRKKGEADQLRKAASQLTQSNQKKVGTRIKDINRKMRAVEDPEGIAVPSSTERVRKHSQDKIKFDFYSRKQKVEHVAKAVNSTLAVLSPQSKVHTVSQTCPKSLSPTSRCNVASKIIGIHYLILIRQFLTNVIKYRTVHDGLFSEAL